MLKTFNEYFSQQMRCNTNAIESPFGHSTQIQVILLTFSGTATSAFFSLALVTKWSISNRRTQKVIIATSVLEMSKFSRSVMTFGCGKLCKIAFQTRHTIFSGSFGLNKICTLTHLLELYMCPCDGFRSIDKSRVR